MKNILRTLAIAFIKYHREKAEYEQYQQDLREHNRRLLIEELREIKKELKESKCHKDSGYEDGRITGGI